MRLGSCLGFAAATVALLFACSSSESTPAGSSSSSGGSSGGSSGDGTSSSGGSSGTPSSDLVKTTTESLEHQGTARQYIVSVPVDYGATKKYPLYIWLHGNPGTAQNAAGFALETVTKKAAIIAYPGAIVSDGWDHGASVADNVDSSFILAMLETLKGKYSIDAKRVLLSGWSGGGFMSSAMACRFYASFRAIGIHAGGAPYDPNDDTATPDCPGAAIATLVTHGEADDNVPFAGGEYAGQYWSEHNGCAGTKAASTPAPCQTYDGCPADKPVKVCFIPGLGHPLWDKALETEWAWFESLP